jgi:tetratricopeptide (TPR) repeat protein
MEDLKWSEFLDRIAIEKKLKSKQKTTLKAKFPTFNGIRNEKDVIAELGLTGRETLTSRLGRLYKIFGIEGDGKDKANTLHEYLRQESLNWLSKQEQEQNLISQGKCIDEQLTSDSAKTTKSNLDDITPLKYPPIPQWVGRDQLIAELHNDLQQGYQVLVLRGQSGIGKTSLAVKLMEACGIEPWRLALSVSCLYDNALFFKVEDSDGFDALAASFLNAFGLGASHNRAISPTQTIDTILARLQQERWLVVIDNLESLMETDSGYAKSADVGELLNMLVNVAHQSQVVITSRKFPDDLTDRHGGPSTVGVVSDRLILGISKEASIQLLQNLGASQADLEPIAKRVNGNVRMLGWLADISRKRPGRLRKKPELVTAEAKPLVLEQWGFQGAPAQDLLKRMCVLRLVMDIPALTTLRLLQTDGTAMESTPEAEAVTEDLLIKLGKSDLVQELYDESLGESRFVLHPLMAETFQDIFAADLEALWGYAARLYGSIDRPEELHSPDDLKFVLEELHFYWLLRTEDQYVIQGAMDILPKLRQWCYGDLGEEWLQRILTVQTELGRAEIASFWGVLGDIARKQGNYDRAEALYHQFLDVSIELGDRAGMASAWGGLEDIARNQGDYEKAEALHQSQEVFYTELGDRAVIASLWGILRDIDRNWENYEKAEALCNQSLQIYTELGNRAGMATSLSMLGFITNRRGNYDQAEELYQTCLDIYTELGNRAGMATSLGMLGFIANRQGNYDQAEELYQKCLDIQTDLDNQAGMATSWGGQGNIASKRGNYDEAEKLYNQSLKLRTKLGDRVGMATSLRCLGENELRRRNLEAAETWLKKALAAMEDLQITWQIAETNWGLAQLYRIKGDKQTAQAHYLISHKLYTKLGSKGVLERIEKEWL